MSIAYLGPPGSFSHEACVRFAQDHEPWPFSSFEKVVCAVETGGAQYGMLPLSNSISGETGCAALIEGAGLEITAVRDLHVRMHLLARPGTGLADVHTIASHPVALRQCGRFLEESGAAIDEVASTSLAAAQAVAGRAAIGSESAAAAHALQILKCDVHDPEENVTRFAVIARRQR
jgi:prephenate dehydratase